MDLDKRASNIAYTLVQYRNGLIAAGETEFVELISDTIDLIEDYRDYVKENEDNE